MVASAVFITDHKGKPLIFRNYRGDIRLSITDEFQKILVQNEVDERKPIVCSKVGEHDVTFCFVEHNDLYCMYNTLLEIHNKKEWKNLLR